MQRIRRMKQAALIMLVCSIKINGMALENDQEPIRIRTALRDARLSRCGKYFTSLREPKYSTLELWAFGVGGIATGAVIAHCVPRWIRIMKQFEK